MENSIGRFEIRRELGRGAQSVVYLAYDPQLQREVAIKTLHFSKSDAQRNQALLAEARAVSTLAHPNIVPIFDAGEEGGDPFLVFEFVDGPSLTELGLSFLFRVNSNNNQLTHALADTRSPGETGISPL